MSPNHSVPHSFLPLMVLSSSVAVLSFNGALVCALSVVLATFAVLRLRSGASRGGTVARRLWVPAPVGGLVPVLAGYTVFRTGAIARQVMGLSELQLAGVGISFLVLIVTTFLLGRFAFPKEEMQNGWRRVAGQKGDRVFRRRYNRALVNSIFWGLGILGFMHIVPNEMLGLASVALVMATAVVLDIGDEIDFRRKNGFYVTVVSTTKLSQIPQAVAALEGRGLNTFVRGIRLRQMLGPVTFASNPVEVMVSGDELEPALEWLKSAGLGPEDGVVDIDEKRHAKTEHQQEAE